MIFKNEQLNRMNEIEQLTSNGFEIYENNEAIIFINHNPDIDLSDFIGSYIDYDEYIVLKNWNPFGYVQNDFEIIKIIL